MEGETELNDPEDEEREEREDDGELDDRLAVLAMKSGSCDMSCDLHLGSLDSKGFGASAEVGGSSDCISLPGERALDGVDCALDGAGETGPRRGEQDADDDDRENERVLDERLAGLVLERAGEERERAAC